ncbi:MAG: hypothetical protein ACLR1V_10830 [Coprococcus sp.]
MTQGDFTDLCRGPHVDNVKLMPLLQAFEDILVLIGREIRTIRFCRESMVYVSRQLRN